MSHASARTLGLVAVFQTQAPTKPSQPFPVRSSCRIGHSVAADHVLDDAAVAGVHAEFRPEGGGLIVQDLASPTGTFVNGMRVGSTATHALVGATIRLGGTVLCVVQDVTPFKRYPITTTGTFVGGPVLAWLLEQIAAVRPGTDPVLFEGEPGLDKPCVARFLQESAARSGSIAEIDCRARTADQLDKALFGDGATTAGALRLAEPGTILLEHIDALPLAIQDRLVKLISGSGVDARLVATSSAPLDDRVRNGQFRAQLLALFSSRRIQVPPLRDRHEDVPAIAISCLPGDAPPFTVEAMELLLGWHWPGNLRELRTTVSAAAARAAMDRAERILPEHLPPTIRTLVATLGTTANAPRNKGDAELRARLTASLRHSAGNVEDVAKSLGFGVPWLYTTLRRLGIDPETFRPRG